MEIKDKYVRKYWYHMVEDQVFDEYVAKGYHVERHYRYSDNFVADLYATNEDEKIIIEIITTDKSNEQIIQLYKQAKEAGCKFNIISANYSHFETQIEFEDFAETFVDFLNAQNPGEFGEFGTHSRVEDISDYDIKSINVYGNTLKIKGNCVVELLTWFDNEGDTEFTYYVPIQFLLDYEYKEDGWEVIDADVLEIDTSQLND